MFITIKEISLKYPILYLSGLIIYVTDEFRERKIEAIKKNDLDKSRKYEYYDHNVVLSEINCRKKLAKTKMYVDYDDAGEVLTSYTYNNREWKEIAPGSLGEKLYQKLCMTRKAPLNQKKLKKSLKKKKSKIHSSRQKVQRLKAKALRTNYRFSKT